MVGSRDILEEPREVLVASKAVLTLNLPSLGDNQKDPVSVAMREIYNLLI